MIVFPCGILENAQQTGQVLSHLAARLAGIDDGDVQRLGFAGQLVVEGVQICAVIERKGERLLEVPVQ